MTGILVYTDAGAERNRWFIERMISCAAKKGITLKLAYADRPMDTCGASFAVVRAFDASINERLEKKGLRVFNNSLTARVGNDKWLAYELCTELGLPVMPTYRDIPDVFPVVVKSVDGHGGEEVFWANGILQAISYARELAERGKRTIFQQPCSAPGVDVRLYVIGGRVVAAAERTGVGFKSNYSLGGSARTVEPTPDQTRAAQKIAAHLRSDYIGVDLIKHDGSWVVNEIEDAAGARMLYDLGAVDIAELFIRHIAEHIA